MGNMQHRSLIISLRRKVFSVNAEVKFSRDFNRRVTSRRVSRDAACEYLDGYLERASASYPAIYIALDSLGLGRRVLRRLCPRSASCRVAGDLLPTLQPQEFGVYLEDD